jgi:hypothetical protein
MNDFGNQGCVGQPIRNHSGPRGNYRQTSLRRYKVVVLRI